MADIMRISSLVQGPLVPPTTLMSLPAEVLHEIACYFKDPRVLPDGLFAWESPAAGRAAAHRTIMSLRLTCRALHVAASPLLMPLVDVDMSQESLDRLDALSRNPLIARGVRALHVNLAFCPARLADSISAFVQMRQYNLDELMARCRDAEGPAGTRLEEADRARNSIKIAWKMQVDGIQTQLLHDRYTRRHQAALRPAHQAFRRRHEEQLRLIGTGGFVASISGAASRMPLLASLRMCHRPARPSRWDRDPWLAFSPDEDLSGWLDAPMTWPLADRNAPVGAGYPVRPGSVLPSMHSLLNLGGPIEPDHRAPGLPPTRLLTDVPIALRGAGVQLRRVDIACFPCMPQSLALLDPGNGTAWAADLRAAFVHVEAVSISPGSRSDAHPNLLASELPELVEYLSAALSPPRLRSADLSLPKSIVLVDDRSGSRRPIRVGRALLSLASPLLEELAVDGVSLHLAELDAFCPLLSPSLRRFTLDNVALLSGATEDAMRVLERMQDSVVEFRARMFLLGRGPSELRVGE